MIAAALHRFILQTVLRSLLSVALFAAFLVLTNLQVNCIYTVYFSEPFRQTRSIGVLLSAVVTDKRPNRQKTQIAIASCNSFQKGNKSW